MSPLNNALLARSVRRDFTLMEHQDAPHLGNGLRASAGQWWSVSATLMGCRGTEDGEWGQRKSELGGVGAGMRAEFASENTDSDSVSKANEGSSMIRLTDKNGFLT
ncbi:hypothetical protein Nepgr_027142 [Nepenthes gracilis]|uniref:Uncharacterized protein n=1 Tax=Nepenthes gracilis TaxID=150966 RepID=A0AAD3T9T1_NEPGR|nr:hypothetical protein Nepgr_027142 [Nepenthes gracilis]